MLLHGAEICNTTKIIDSKIQGMGMKNMRAILYKIKKDRKKKTA